MKPYDNSVMVWLIDEKIHNELHRRVLKARLVDGKTYEAIAEEVNRTPRQIGYIIAKESAKLFELL